MHNRSQHTSKPSLMKDSPFVSIGQIKTKWLRRISNDTNPERKGTGEFRNISQSFSVQKILETFYKSKPAEHRCTTSVRDLEGGRRPVQSTAAKRSPEKPDPTGEGQVTRTPRLGERIISVERRGGARPKDETDYYKDPNSFKQSAFIHLTDVNDSNKLANYTRYYSYDTGGNLTAIQHVAADSQRSFTREIHVDAGSNRWLPANMGPDPDYGDYYDADGNITALEHLGGIAWNYRDSISSAVLLEREGGPGWVYCVPGGRPIGTV